MSKTLPEIAQQEFRQRYKRPTDGGESLQYWRGQMQAFLDGAAWQAGRQISQPAIKESLTTVQPAAEVVPKYGDPEEFGERDITLLVDIQKLPYGTKFYTAPVPQASWQQAYEDLRRLIADDAYAISFQSMGQYRSALLKSQKDAAISQKENG